MANRSLVARLSANWPAKVLSLFAAILLSVVYRLNRLEDRYLSVPLAVEQGEEYAPATQLPRSVRISLRGESNALFAIQEDDVAARVDLSEYRTEGVYRVPVQIEKRGSALGVDPLEIQSDPSEVVVGIERRVLRSVPVTPAFRGFLEPGFELASFEIAPSEVGVSGPAGAVARVTDVSTEFIELAGRSADFSANVGLVLKEPLVAFSGTGAVVFSAVVRKSFSARTFERLPILPVGLRAGLELAGPLPAGSIRLRSGETVAADYSPAPGALTTDLSSISAPGSYRLPVLAVLPDGLYLESYEPQEVDVLVEAAGARDDPRGSGGAP